jgi:hypothetical protein
MAAIYVHIVAGQWLCCWCLYTISYIVHSMQSPPCAPGAIVQLTSITVLLAGAWLGVQPVYSTYIVR